MKIIDGLNLKGRPAEIPDCSRDDLPQFFVEMGYKTGAEIGVYKGEFSEKLCKAGLKLYAIDPWKYYENYDDTRGQAGLDSLYEHTKRVLAPQPNCAIVKKTSMEAVESFANESLDFVYIDGNHLFKYIAEDIAEWSKKVRKGGTVAGHDYVNFRAKSSLGICHVVQVVNAYTQAYGIRNWYLLGRKDYLTGEKETNGEVGCGSKNNKMKIFLDVGSHFGETLAIAMEDKYRFDKFYCFEPVVECCDEIKKIRDKRVIICEYGLWNKNRTKKIYDPKSRGASLFRDKFRRKVSSANIKLVCASEWFSQNLNIGDDIYLKLNCEGAECVILDNLIDTGEYKKIKVLMVDFDVRKIPSQKHLMNVMKAKLNKLGIPKTFYIDEYNLGKGTHSYFTHYWLGNS